MKRPVFNADAHTPHSGARIGEPRAGALSAGAGPGPGPTPATRECVIHALFRASVASGPLTPRVCGMAEKTQAGHD